VGTQFPHQVKSKTAPNSSNIPEFPLFVTSVMSLEQKGMGTPTHYTPGMRLICLNGKLYHQKQYFVTVTLHINLFIVIDSLTIFTSQIVLHTSVLRKDVSSLSRRLKRIPFRANVLNAICGSSNLNCKKSFVMGAL